MNVKDLLIIDPEILGGTPVFNGTRVPAKTLFEYLERGYSLDELLDCIPTVSRDAASSMLALSHDALLASA